MDNIAVLFPGQGAQYIGMGKDFYDNFPGAREVFQKGDETLNMPISKLIFEGSEEDLVKTEITQPAVLLTSIAIFEVLKEKGLFPKAVAGLSLGEYSALVAAEALSLEDALPLVQKRGRYMQEAVSSKKGAMAALMGMKRDLVESICREASDYGLVQPANYNCPGQIVISGEKKAVSRAMELARENGAQKIIELNVSAPFHCKLMEPVQEKLSRELEKVNIREAKVPLVTNVSAQYISKPKQIEESLVKQVSSAVKWEDSINKMINNGLEVFIEVGPGRVLTGFMKKISREVLPYSIGSLDSLHKLEEKLGKED